MVVGRSLRTAGANAKEVTRVTGQENVSRDQTGRDRPADGLLPWLARLNVTGVFLAATVFVLLGLFAPGIIGGALLLALAAGLGALLRMTWPVQAPQTRMLRLTMLTLLVAIAVLKIF